MAFPFLAFLIISLPLSMADLLLSSICEGDRTFPPNSTFQQNLDTLIYSLSSSTPSTGFYRKTIGDDPDTVFGAALCRGDLTPGNCSVCLSGAYQDIQSNCPGKKEGFLFYELCQLRYSDRNFFGMSSSKLYRMYNPATVSNVAAINRFLGKLLDDLTANATSSPDLFATGSLGDKDSGQTYALVQCTRDLSQKTCDACLKETISYSAVCCGTFSGARIYGGSCLIRIETYKFYNATTNPLGNNKSKSQPVGVVIAATVTSVFVLFVSVVAIVCICRRKRHREKGVGQEENLNQDECLHYSLDDLKLATKNFSDENKLGRGGFGIVYKGILNDGEIIAVKRLVTSAGQGFGELKNEVGVLAKVQHRNLVRLLGYCTQAQEKILVYEYLPNKSLDGVLFDSAQSKKLTWDMRVNIIEGIAKGLLYLHEDSRLKIIHRDIKASNILLDNEMNPKLADFGLARIFNTEQSFENTRRIAGTQGYMAPEYMAQGAISAKSDVYSYGILLLEIITGKRCHGFRHSSSQADLMGYISWLWQNGNPLHVLDTNIRDGVQEEEVQKMIQIGLLSVQYDPTNRPSMSLVVQFLGSNSSSLPSITGPLGFNMTDMTFNIQSGETNILWHGYDIGSFTLDTATFGPR